MTVGTGHHMQYKAKDAYSADNKRLGHIIDTCVDYFLVQEGRLFSTVFCLPSRFLIRSDADRAYLSVTKDEVRTLRRQELPPDGDAWYTDEPPANTMVPA
jgi:hypothetical protein